MRAAFVIGWLAACAPSSSEHASSLSADPRFEIRISETTVGANGHTKREVFVFGTKADGSFSTERVVVGLDRASAGSFTATALELGTHGARTYFVPCNQATAGCLGAAKLTVARAADPSTIVASVDVDLVAPVHVSSAVTCASSKTTMMHIDGNDYIRNGMLDVTELADPAFVQLAADATSVRLSLTPARIAQGNGWSVHITSDTALATGIYPNAVRPGAGTPGLDVTGNSRGCNTIAGTFEIHELAITAGALQKLMVSFEQHCDGMPGLLEGCFRYAKP